MWYVRMDAWATCRRLETGVRVRVHVLGFCMLGLASSACLVQGRSSRHRQHTAKPAVDSVIPPLAPTTCLFGDLLMRTSRRQVCFTPCVPHAGSQSAPPPAVCQGQAQI